MGGEEMASRKDEMASRINTPFSPQFPVNISTDGFTRRTTTLNRKCAMPNRLMVLSNCPTAQL